MGKRRRHRLKRRSLATIGGLLAAVVGTLLLVGRSRRDAGDVRAWLAARDPAPAELNVVVVTIDTLRADRLGCYGYRGVETPFIDELAQRYASPLLRYFPDLGLLESGVADAASEELGEQPLLDLAGLVDHRQRRHNRLVNIRRAPTLDFYAESVAPSVPDPPNRFVNR